MAKILIPTPLRQFTEKSDSVEQAGSTVGEVLGGLTSRFPDLRKQLYNDEGKLRSFVNVYLNDEDIRYLQKDATAVAAGDTLSIVPSIAGGRRRTQAEGLCHSGLSTVCSASGTGLQPVYRRPARLA
jgi:adenylyltransferase/sulfurtransferase